MAFPSTERSTKKSVAQYTYFELIWCSLSVSVDASFYLSHPSVGRRYSSPIKFLDLLSDAIAAAAEMAAAADSDSVPILFVGGQDLNSSEEKEREREKRERNSLWCLIARGINLGQFFKTSLCPNKIFSVFVLRFVIDHFDLSTYVMQSTKTTNWAKSDPCFIKCSFFLH